MDIKIVTKGICTKCNKLLTKISAKNHIDKCFNQGEVSPDAFMIKVQWPHKIPIYWLYLAVPLKATLKDLDVFLRDTWLECCLHLSRFNINNKRFSSDFEPNREVSIKEFSMSISSKKVLALGVKFTHEYDLGTTTELLLEVIGLIKAETSNQISIMIRNQEPEIECDYCDNKAIAYCPHEEDLLCESCIEDDEFLLPVVNSPRSGICGYVG